MQKFKPNAFVYLLITFILLLYHSIYGRRWKKKSDFYFVSRLCTNKLDMDYKQVKCSRPDPLFCAYKTKKFADIFFCTCYFKSK